MPVRPDVYKVGQTGNLKARMVAYGAGTVVLKTAEVVAEHDAEDALKAVFVERFGKPVIGREYFETKDVAAAVSAFDEVAGKYVSKPAIRPPTTAIGEVMDDAHRVIGALTIERDLLKAELEEARKEIAELKRCRKMPGIVDEMIGNIQVGKLIRIGIGVIRKMAIWMSGDGEM
jgi:hypothetical protein